MDNMNDTYAKYGIDNKKKPFDKERLEKAIDGIEYCRQHLAKINETREALFKVLDELPKMHGMIIELARHVYRIEVILGLAEEIKDDGQNGGMGGH